MSYKTVFVKTELLFCGCLAHEKTSQQKCSTSESDSSSESDKQQTDRSKVCSMLRAVLFVFLVVTV